MEMNSVELFIQNGKMKLYVIYRENGREYNFNLKQL